MRQIYVASSWKNAQVVLKLTDILRDWGHCVYCFAEKFDGQHHFNWQDIPHVEDLDGITCLTTEDSNKAYKCDKWFLDWADTCVLYLPCGRDAHLEAGYIKGKGGQTFIVGEFPRGEFSNMYHLADGLVRLKELEKLRDLLNMSFSQEARP